MPEGAGAKRGRFEKAFAQIGGACMIGKSFFSCCFSADLNLIAVLDEQTTSAKFVCIH